MKHFRFAVPLVLLAAAVAARADEPIGEPYSPEKAARTMVVPDRFSVDLFAGEPEIRQPISFCIDDRGRLWVAEAYNYPHRDRPPQDRVVILEDTDRDGRADKRDVFFTGLGYVTGIEVGFGGVWIMSPPQMLFIPNADGDVEPDGPPQVLLDGFGNQPSAHNIANGFTWGPDGWLYAGHGRTSPSDVGPPGTPAAERIHFDGGVYRYHPVRHVFEGFCDGTTNPWGVDFDDYGQAFISNCVNPHLFHAVQGAHYEPWRGRESSLHAYQRIDTIADHLHWVGGKWQDSRGYAQEQLALGGGHAHCGTMIYLGDNWPQRYRNTVFMCNVHGRRINNDTLGRRGSGYVASHAPDVMIAKDPWFKGVTLRYGPDGAVYVSDWSDTGECHDYRETQRQTGRIYKIRYGTPKQAPVDIAGLDDDQLVELQLHDNDWYVRHARRVLHERNAAGADLSGSRAALRSMLDSHSDVTRRLRALWCLHVIGDTDEPLLRQLLDDADPHLRSWAVRLLCEPKSIEKKVADKMTEMAAQDASPIVRRELASAVMRLPAQTGWPIAARLVTHTEDAGDPNLPLLYWYGLEPLVAADRQRAMTLLRPDVLPKVRQFLARRAASGDGDREGIALLVESLHAARDADVRLDILRGMQEALRGRRDLKTPPGWKTAYDRLGASKQEPIRRLALRVGLLLDDRRAAAKMREILADSQAPADDRREALADLLEQLDPRLPAVLFDLLNDDELRGEALKGLASFEEPRTAEKILARYGNLSFEEKQSALATLASRPKFAAALLDATLEGRVPAGDFQAVTVRQLRELKDQRIEQRLDQIWGVIGGNAKDRQAQIRRYKKRLERSAEVDLEHGRLVYKRTCAACHKLFGEGGDVGPEITGAARTNLDYLLENILDPNALVPKDFQLNVIQTTGGRVISGLIVERSDATLTVQTQNEKVVLPIDDIAAMKVTPVSMMPSGLLEKLSDADVRDLMAYLASPRQVPLPAESTQPAPR